MRGAGAFYGSQVVYPLLLIGVAFVWQKLQTLTSTSVIALSMLSVLNVLAIQLALFHPGLIAEFAMFVSLCNESIVQAGESDSDSVTTSGSAV